MSQNYNMMVDEKSGVYKLTSVTGTVYYMVKFHGTFDGIKYTPTNKESWRKI